MVASRQVEIPFYRGIGRQRGRGFGALAQVFRKTFFPFPRKYIVSPAKRMGSDLLEFAVPEIADVVSGWKSSRQPQRVREDKLWESNWVVVAGKGVQAESFQQNLQNKPVGREETFSQALIINHIE